MYEFLISTQNEIVGYKIVETYGLVYGNIVRSTNIIRTLFAGLRTILGGEIPEFTKVVQDARDHAVMRLTDHAKALGANGVVGVRFTTAEVMQACSEILAYGTAVKLEKM